MKTKKKFYRQFIELIFITMIATIIGMISGGAVVFTEMNRKTEIPNNEHQADANEILKVYNEIIEKYYSDVDEKELIDGAIDGMLSVLGDPNTSYLDELSKDTFDERMLGQYYGVGFEILADNSGKVYVVNLFQDSPAKKAGVKVGDYIVKVDGNSVEGKTALEISSLVKYGKNQDVKITVNRNGVEKDFNITKNVIVLESVTNKTYNKNGKKIGYIQVEIFASNTYEQFKSALKTLKNEKIDKLVIDLRSNTGGYLTAVTSMLELMLKENSILYKLESKSETISTLDKTKESVNYPIAVLINEYSASAAEVMASSLNENVGAILVGANSYGKGTVQETIDISNGGMAKFTTKKWLTPKGNWIDGKGLKPDYEVVLDEEYLYDSRDENDNQLQKALELIVK